MAAINDNMFASITSVQLHIRSEIDARRASSIITRTPHITQLSIYFDIGWDMLHSRISAEICRDLAYMTFQSEEAICQFQRLRSLCLNDCTLTLLGPALSRSVNFSMLETLRLVRCDSAGHMLLSLGMKEVDWKMLCIEEEECGDDNGELKSFLQTLSTPKVLSIGRERSYAEEDSDAIICWKDLVPHSSTLESLRLNVDQPSGHRFDHRRGRSVANFREFCKSASNLDQLALTCPPIEEEKWQDEHGFTVFLVRTKITLSLYQQC
jgi:hypothetical protein